MLSYNPNTPSRLPRKMASLSHLNSGIQFTIPDSPSFSPSPFLVSSSSISRRASGNGRCILQQSRKPPTPCQVRRNAEWSLTPSMRRKLERRGWTVSEWMSRARDSDGGSDWALHSDTEGEGEVVPGGEDEQGGLNQTGRKNIEQRLKRVDDEQPNEDPGSTRETSPRRPPLHPATKRSVFSHRLQHSLTTDMYHLSTPPRTAGLLDTPSISECLPRSSPTSTTRGLAVYEHLPTPLSTRLPPTKNGSAFMSRRPSTPLTATPRATRRMRGGPGETGPLPHDRYLPMPDEYFLHDGLEYEGSPEQGEEGDDDRESSPENDSEEGTEKDTKSLLGITKKREAKVIIDESKGFRGREDDILKDMVYMQENINHMQSLPHIYPLEHLDLEFAPSYKKYGQIASSPPSPKNIPSGFLLSPTPKSKSIRLRHAVSTSALLDPHPVPTSRRHGIPRPNVDERDTQIAEDCLDWLADFEVNVYYKYQSKAATIIQSGFASTYVIASMQTSTQALVLEVTYAREILRRECQIRRVMPTVLKLRAKWDDQRWKIQHGTECFKTDIARFIRLETNWVKSWGGAVSRRQGDETTDTEAYESDSSIRLSGPGTERSSKIPRLKKTSNRKPAAGLDDPFKVPEIPIRYRPSKPVTIIDLEFQLRKLQDLLEGCWNTLQSILDVCKPCHGLRLVPPEEEQPTDKRWRHKHRDKYCKETKTPVKVWGKMTLLENGVKGVSSEFKKLHQICGGWDRANVIRKRLVQLQADAKALAEEARTGQTDLTRLKELREKLNDDFTLDDPRLVPESSLSPSTIMGVRLPSDIQILLILDMETRRTASDFATCDEAMKASLERSLTTLEQKLTEVRKIADTVEDITDTVSADNSACASTTSFGLDNRGHSVACIDRHKHESVQVRLDTFKAELYTAEIRLRNLAEAVADEVHQSKSAYVSPGDARKLLSLASKSVDEANKIVQSNLEEREVLRIASQVLTSLTSLWEESSDLEIDLLKALEVSKWNSAVRAPAEDELEKLTIAVQGAQQRLHTNVEDRLQGLSAVLAATSPKLLRQLREQTRSSQSHMKSLVDIQQSVRRVSNQRRHAEQIQEAAQNIRDLSTRISTYERKESEWRILPVDGQDKLMLGSFDSLLKDLEDRVRRFEVLVAATPMAADVVSDASPSARMQLHHVSNAYMRQADAKESITPPGLPRVPSNNPDIIAEQRRTYLPHQEITNASRLALCALGEVDLELRQEMNNLFIRVKAEADMVRRTDVVRESPVGKVDLQHGSEIRDLAKDAAADAISRHAPSPATETIETSAPALTKTAPDLQAHPKGKPESANAATASKDLVATEGTISTAPKPVRPHPLLDAAVKKAIRRTLPHDGDLQVMATSMPKVETDSIGGSYTFTWGDKSITRFCRILLGTDKILVMVRVGGGWEGLDEFVNRAFHTVFEKTHTAPVSPEMSHAFLMGMGTPGSDRGTAFGDSPTSVFRGVPALYDASPFGGGVFLFRSPARNGSESPEMRSSVPAQRGERPSSPIPPSAASPVLDPTADRPPTRQNRGRRAVSNGFASTSRSPNRPSIPRPPSLVGRNLRVSSSREFVPGTRGLKTQPSLTEMMEKMKAAGK